MPDSEFKLRGLDIYGERSGTVSARRIALVVLVAAALAAPQLKAQASVTYPVGSGPTGIAFDGANIWVTYEYSGSVTKLLASTGATVGTYPVGGAGSQGICFDGENIWVTNFNSASVTKLLASTGELLGTFTVGSGPWGIAFDGVNIWVANYGSDNVTKLLASTGATVGTYPVGGAPQSIVFDGTNIWVDTGAKLLASTGELLGTYPVGGTPRSIVFDGTNIWVTNSLSGTVTKLLASTGALVGTYPAGTPTGLQGPDGIAFDGTNIWVTNDDAYGTVTKLLASTGALVETYTVGGGPVGALFDGSDIWVTNQGSASVTKINPAAPLPPSISPAGVVPIYSTASTIQPGEWVTIWGSNLASGTASWNGDFPISLGGTSVAINTKPAYLWYVSPTQINLQAPDDSATGTVNVVVTTGGGTATSTVTLAQFAPSLSLFGNKYVAGVILTPNGSGAYGNGTYDLVGPSGHFSFNTRPVNPGETLELFGVGFGPTSPNVLAGQVFMGSAPTTNTVTFTIGGVPASVQFSGLTEAGLYQFNLLVPATASGDQLVQASVGGVQTPGGVYITVGQ